MPIEPERFQLSTRNNMARATPYDTSIRERAEEGDDDLGLSESENSVSAEMIRECATRDCGWSLCFLQSPEADS